MIFNDTSTRQGGIQEAEDICGLGATGITGNTALFQQFVRWFNKWAKIGIKIALNAQDGFDVDDPNWTTYPSGTYTGTTNRDYVFSATEQMLKIKTVGLCYDGTNYVKAIPIDSSEFANVKADPNIDSLFGNMIPCYDPKANAIDIYPKFTQAQVDAGAKVYVEFYREPREYATSGTDSYVLPFPNLITKGASYEYACLYKPDLASSLRSDLYGNNANIKGIVKDMEEEYSYRYPVNKKIIPKWRNPR